MTLLRITNKKRTLLGCALIFALTAPCGAAQAPMRSPAITKKIDETKVVRLAGNVRPEATAQNDRGAVGDAMQFDDLQLLLRRSAASEAALSAYMERQQTPGDPAFHHWLTPAEIGAKYGPSNTDIATVTDWLQMHGFQVNSVSPSGMRVDFSGTAGQIIESFRTEIHHLEVNGKQHVANMQDPEIPEALSPVVAGITSLNDFKPHAMHKGVVPVTATGASRAAVSPNYTVDTGFELMVPADLATIYDFNPLFKTGTAGQGQTIILLEKTNLYSNNDYFTFRKAFGLTKYTDSKFSVVHPRGCASPGVVVNDDSEAAVDVEWAAAAAPAANIELASCKDTTTRFGGFIALQALVDQKTHPAIVSLSYGEPEADLGASGNLYIYRLYQQAAAEGISLFISSGDAGAADDSQDTPYAHNGINVSGYASTPFNLAAGGTDYSDGYYGTASTYWSNTNSNSHGSARSYIPEIPWNDSCASMLITKMLGFAVPYGPKGACNSSAGEGYLSTGAASGGPSRCGHGTATSAPATNGSCKGYAKPSWQQGLHGNPADGVRDLPDVSLFAANGAWGHYYVVCYSDTKGGGVPCTGTPSNWAGMGGTSFVAPILAGVQALINQKWGRQGNPDPAYYALAKTSYGQSGNASCNSSHLISKTCIFHDVTLGDMDVNCRGTVNCYRPSGTNGVLSVNSKQYQPAYRATSGWDFATGIGTLDVSHLVQAWSRFK